MAEALEDIEALIAQTSNLHCFEEAVELEECVEAEVAENRVLAVGKLISLKPYSGSFIRSILSQMWSLPKKLKVKELERNKFMFLFPSAKDKRRILERGPWTINRDHLVLKDVPPSLSIQEVDFSSIFFWVRITGLPRDAILESNITVMASKIGSLLEIDKRSLGHDYRFCRAREGATVSNGFLRVPLYGPWLRAESSHSSCFEAKDVAAPPFMGQNRGREEVTSGDCTAGELYPDGRPSDACSGEGSLGGIRNSTAVYQTSYFLACARGVDPPCIVAPDEVMEGVEINIVEDCVGRQANNLSEFDRSKRKGFERYSGDFLDCQIEQCYHPEEYYSEIIADMREPCEVDQFQAHQALLAPFPTPAEWRAQKGINEDGSRRPPSKKRKAQSFVIPLDLDYSAGPLNQVQPLQIEYPDFVEPCQHNLKEPSSSAKKHVSA
ncbi:hypothetical protein TorRG33x02_357820, partial [Trema orientale]